MADTVLQLDPAAARTAVEYVTLLRQVRVQSGLSYRAIERRAEKAGETLPSSTLASALCRSSLPREELVAAFLRACGTGPDEVASWVEARRRVAWNSTGPVPASGVPALARPGEVPVGSNNTPADGDPTHPAGTSPAGDHGQPSPQSRRHSAWLTAVIATARAVGVAMASSPGRPYRVGSTRSGAAG